MKNGKGNTIWKASLSMTMEIKGPKWSERGRQPMLRVIDTMGIHSNGRLLSWNINGEGRSKNQFGENDFELGII